LGAPSTGSTSSPQVSSGRARQHAFGLAPWQKGEDEGGREQQNIEYRIMNNEVGKKEINVWEKLFTVIDIVCRIVPSNSDSFFRQKSGDRSQESELGLAGIGVHLRYSTSPKAS